MRIPLIYKQSRYKKRAVCDCPQVAGYFVLGNHCSFLRREELVRQTAKHLGLAILFEGCVYIAGTAVLAYPLFAAHPAISNSIVHKLLPFGAACFCFRFLSGRRSWRRRNSRYGLRRSRHGFHGQFLLGSGIVCIHFRRRLYLSAGGQQKQRKQQKNNRKMFQPSYLLCAIRLVIVVFSCVGTVHASFSSCIGDIFYTAVSVITAINDGQGSIFIAISSFCRITVPASGKALNIPLAVISLVKLHSARVASVALPRIRCGISAKSHNHCKDTYQCNCPFLKKAPFSFVVMVFSEDASLI